MKKTQRIFGRRMARELSRNELEKVNGSLASEVQTWTTSYPPDQDPPPDDGPIWV